MRAGQAGGHGGVKDNRDWSSVRDASGAEITEALIEQEAGEFFDDHFNGEALKAAAQATNVEFTNLDDVQSLRSSFIQAARNNFRPQLNNIKGPRNQR